MFIEDESNIKITRYINAEKYLFLNTLIIIKKYFSNYI